LLIWWGTADISHLNGRQQRKKHYRTHQVGSYAITQVTEEVTAVERVKDTHRLFSDVLSMYSDLGFRCNCSYDLSEVLKYRALDNPRGRGPSANEVVDILCRIERSIKDDKYHNEPEMKSCFATLLLYMMSRFYCSDMNSADLDDSHQRIFVGLVEKYQQYGNVEE